MAISDHSADTQHPRTKLRLDSLTGLRWWAAFGVFAYHFLNVGEFTGSYLALMGYTGVAFFFVLSGFVLTWSARPTTTVRQFWVRRFARIWPAHLVALLLSLPVFYTFSMPSHAWEKPWQWGPILACTVLLQGFTTNTLYLFGGNPAAWTLSCEAFFYALHPAVHRCFRALRTWMLPILMGLCVLAALLLSAHPIVSPPLARCWEFFLGVLAALLLKRGVRLRVPMVVLYLILLGLTGTYWMLNRAGYFPEIADLMAPNWSIVLPLVYAGAVMIAASADLDGRRSLMRHPIMVRGGEWSYCFYLVHATVLYGASTLFDTVHFGFIGFCLLLLTSVAAAAGLYYLVERPCEKRIRRWGDRRFGCT